MSSFARVSLLIGMLLAASAASAGAAGSSQWHLVARAHKWPTASGMPVIHLRMPVGVVAGKRQPEALAVRLLVRRKGLYQQGWIGYTVTCGGWRHYRRAFRVKTPFRHEIPFRTWRARACTISTGAYSESGSDDIRLQLLCRARARSACAPFTD